MTTKSRYLKQEYFRLREKYSDFPFPNKAAFDTELACNIISNRPINVEKL